MRMLIKNGRVIDPASNTDDIRDILVEDGVIAEVAKDIDKAADTVIDAKGCMVMPGLVDLHVHFREPGFEHKETIRTGARAAARGGFTTVCPMPNTKPAIDSVEMVEYIKNKSEEVTDINILPIAAMTAGQDGEYITDYERLYEEGAVAVSEDGKSVMNARVARQAMRLAAEVGIPVFAHCEDKDLAARGVMNAGNKARELGFYGIMNSVEDIMVARDLLLAKNTGAKLHICHVSTEDSVRMIAAAKKEGLDVTAEVTPHHLTEKDRGFVEAPFGISGLETAVAIIMTDLVKKNVITPLEMADKMSYTPAKTIGIDKGTLLVGKTADITIIDPDAEYVIDSKTFASRGKNTPFNGKKVSGEIKYTIAGGKIVYSNINGTEVIIDKDVPKL